VNLTRKTHRGAKEVELVPEKGLEPSRPFGHWNLKADETPFWAMRGQKCCSFRNSDYPTLTPIRIRTITQTITEARAVFRFTEDVQD